MHKEAAASILEAVIPDRKASMRIGITGTPGVGKSTFIESLGIFLADEKKLNIAVLAIDPTSTRSGGSILGDKTRMSELSTRDNVFIRPSPSKGSLGGVAEATMESIYLLEAAGYDVILVETVGVGQSETAVHGMVDFFMLLLQPGSGDQLQGIKRGIMEMADGIIVNKADGALLEKARESAREYTMAIQLMPAVREDWRARVLHCSAIENRNIDGVWKMVQNFFSIRKTSGEIKQNRLEQELDWFGYAIREGLVEKALNGEEFKTLQSKLKEKIRAGQISPFRASQEVIGKLRIQWNSDK